MTGLRFLRTTCATLVVATLLVGCGSSSKGNDVDESLTESAALTQLYTYLRQTVDALPSGIGFALQPDTADRDTLGDAHPMPCFDGYREHGPWQVQMNYWVVGLPSGSSAQYFDQIRRIWTDFGWREDSNATATLAGFATPDKYTLVVRDAQLEPNGLSITAASPCFPDTNRGGDRPVQPTEIKHP